VKAAYSSAAKRRESAKPDTGVIAQSGVMKKSARKLIWLATYGVGGVRRRRKSAEMKTAKGGS